MVDVKFTGLTVKPYSVSGATLLKINNFLTQHGPVVDGKKRSGATKTTIAIGAKYNISGRFIHEGKKVTCHIGIKTAAVSYGATMKIPSITPPILSNLSQKAAKEWKRFAAAVRKHEDGHVACAKNVATKIAAEIDAIAITATGKSEKDAQAAATKAIKNLWDSTYTTKAAGARLTAEQKAYDKRTKHGKNVKAVLDYKVK